MTGEAILGVVMVPMTVCRERVDWYGMGFWGEYVADPFLGPVTTYSTLYSGRFPFLSR
jgi:hypothetical protein